MNLCGYLTGSHASDLTQTIVRVLLLKMHFYTRSQSSEWSSEDDDDDGLADSLITIIPSFSSVLSFLLLFFVPSAALLLFLHITEIETSHPRPARYRTVGTHGRQPDREAAYRDGGMRGGVKKNPPIHILCFIPFLFYPFFFFSFLVATAWAPR